jgi:hypothetical protein
VCEEEEDEPLSIREYKVGIRLVLAEGMKEVLHQYRLLVT